MAWGDGYELSGITEHEQRVAWLYVHEDTWAPLSLMQMEDERGVEDERGGPCLVLGDGHHRLAATLLLGQPVTISVDFGYREEVSDLLHKLGASTVLPATTGLFGRGIFLSQEGTEGVHVYTAGTGPRNFRCWLEDTASGECVARHSSQLWHTTDGGAHSLRAADTPEDAHVTGFSAACEAMLGNADAGLTRYLLSEYRHAERQNAVIDPL